MGNESNAAPRVSVPHARPNAAQRCQAHARVRGGAQPGHRRGGPSARDHRRVRQRAARTVPVFVEVKGEPRQDQSEEGDQDGRRDGAAAGARGAARGVLVGAQRVWKAKGRSACASEHAPRDSFYA